MNASTRFGFAAAAALGVSVLGLPTARGYNMNYANWCDREDLVVNVNLDSFLERGFAADAQIDQQIRTAATWWSDSQAGLRFSYGSLTAATGEGDPGNVSAACCVDGGACEDGLLADNPGWIAYTDYSYDFWTSCDLFFGATDGWKIVVRANGDRACGNVSNWGLDVGDVRSGATWPLFVTLTHEFGHVLGFGHGGCDNEEVMCSWIGSRRLITSDEVAGLRAIEGWDARQIKTVTAVRWGGTLSFGTARDVDSHTAMWKPAISGNPGGSPAWDYALAWQRLLTSSSGGPYPVNTYAAEIRVAVANDGLSSNLVLGTVHDTGRHSNNAIGVSVGWANAIGVAYVPAEDPRRRVHFMVSTDDGATWTESVPGYCPLGFFCSGYPAMGGVSVSYDWRAHRWVAAWVGQGCASVAEAGCTDLRRHRVMTIVSDDWTGTSWTQPAVHYQDALTSPNLAPALTCARGDVDRCLLVYRTFDSPNLRRIYQQAFQTTTAEDYLHTLGTVADTGNYGYSDLSLARVSGGYVMSYVWPTMANDRLTYRVKTDTATETGAWDYATQTWAGANSRSGFSVAYNYRTNRIRFLWHEN